jgi:hypothetical protein
VAVLFGGRIGGTVSNDTWEYDGAQWSPRMPLASPPGRRAAAMTFDSSRRVTVLFGGYTSTAVLDDTWLWDGNQWTPSASRGPAGRRSAAIAFDPSRGTTILFGGANGANRGPGLGDLWEF